MTVQRPPDSFPRTALRIILALIFLAALAIRLYDLDDPPLDFHPARQIHSALIARGFFAHLEPDLPDFERDRSMALGNSEIWIEPPVMETLTAAVYYLIGNDPLWVARIYAIVFWLAGGVAVFLLSRQMTDSSGALLALLFYLLLPYGIIASRSFQPDPLMVSLLCFSAWALLRWAQKSTWHSAILAGILSGLCILVKQVAVFMVLGAICAIVLASGRLKEIFKDKQTWLVGALALTPILAYNIYGIFIAGFLAGQYNLRFFPSLLINPAFYVQWATLIDHVVTLPAFLLALLGVLLIEKRGERYLMFGLGAGYILYAMVFAYHASTHDYYHLPLIPLVAMGISPAVLLVIRKARQLHRGWLPTILISAIVVAGCAFSLWQARAELKRMDYRQEPQRWRSLAEKMGWMEAAPIGLFNDYGARLLYWGYIVPEAYPSRGDLKLSQLAGRTPSSEDIASRIAGKNYFIVTDFDEFEHQPELRQFLYDNYPVFQQGDGYLIFDLRHPKEH